MKMVPKMLAVVLALLVIAGCASTPVVESGLKKGDEVTNVAAAQVVVRNHSSSARWGNVVFAAGDTCSLLPGGSIRVMGVAKRPGDSEGTFFLLYWVDASVAHTKENCPPNTIFMMGEGDLVSITKPTK